MADIFLSYARESAETATRVAATLREHGYSVWFDEELPAHRAYADVIAAELDAALAVLVLWSEGATKSQWVRSEANRARERGKLVQARVDDALLPMPFDQIQCPALNLSGDLAAGPGWRSVARGLAALVRGEEIASGPGTVSHRGGPVVAVLGLHEIGSGGEDYLGEGLTEEIVSALAQLRGLRVVPGSAAGVGVGARAAAIALNAGTYLEGSVRKSGERARISVRLVDATDGATRWSETFDRTLSDVFAVQEEIAEAVAAALGVTLIDREAQSISSAASADPKANQLALQARHIARQEMEIEWRTAADLFRQAIARDPEFALAYAGLADMLAQIARLHLQGWDQSAEEALTAARKAVELAPALADSQLALGAALALKRDPGAAHAYSRAVALSPYDPNVHYRMARFLVLSGDKAGAIRHYERAFELAPDDYRYAVYAIQEYQAIGDKQGEESCLKRSAAAIERHLELNPSDVRALGHGAGVMALLGKPKQMQQMIDRAAALRPNDWASLGTLACAAMLNGDAEQALDLLDRSIATGQGDRDWLMEDNDLKPLHGHPRFEALVARMAGGKNA
jgi:adenylate cyclase